MFPLFRLVRRFFFWCLVASILILASDRWIAHRTSDRIADRIEQVRDHRVALVLGCSPTTRDGRPNLYFVHRIDAAAELFRAGLVDQVLVSGDNGSTDYDEPSAMKEALVARGLPPSSIVRDFAGFRTLDSIVRAREIFGQPRLLVISQRFHAERAIYLADHHGIEAEGYAAADVLTAKGARTRIREALARVATLIDIHLIGTEPRFLGPKIEMETAAR